MDYRDPDLDAFVVSPDEQRRRARERWARLGLGGRVRRPAFEPDFVDDGVAKAFTGGAHRPAVVAAEPAVAVVEPDAVVEPEAVFAAAVVEPAVVELDAVAEPAGEAASLERPAALAGTRRVTIRAVIEAAAVQFQIAPRHLLAPSRLRSVTEPRQAAMWVAAELTGEGWPAIGRQFGGRDQSTVRHAVRNVAGAVAAGAPQGVAALALRDAVLQAAAAKAGDRTGDTLDHLVALAAAHYRVPAAAIRRGSQRPAVSQARHAVLWAAAALLPLSQRGLAAAFGCDPMQVRRAVVALDAAVAEGGDAGRDAEAFRAAARALVGRART